MSENTAGIPPKFVNVDPELDDKSLDELESLLVETQSMLERLECELRERRAEQRHLQFAELPADVTKLEGSWADLLQLLRRLAGRS